MNDPFAHIQDEFTGDPFAHITEDNTPSVPMSQAKNLPPTWSPTVKGQKLNAVYDPDAKKPTLRLIMVLLKRLCVKKTVL